MSSHIYQRDTQSEPSLVVLWKVGARAEYTHNLKNRCDLHVKISEDSVSRFLNAGETSPGILSEAEFCSFYFSALKCVRHHDAIPYKCCLWNTK